MTMMTRDDLAAALAKADADTETQFSALAELAEAVRAYLAEQDKDTWTVLGVWDNGEPVPVGAIEGRHDVHGESPGERGDPGYGYDTSSFYEQGVWAVSVTAPDADTAQDLAAAEMTDREDGEEDGNTDQPEHSPGTPQPS